MNLMFGVMLVMMRVVKIMFIRVLLVISFVVLRILVLVMFFLLLFLVLLVKCFIRLFMNIGILRLSGR